MLYKKLKNKFSDSSDGIIILGIIVGIVIGIGLSILTTFPDVPYFVIIIACILISIFASLILSVSDYESEYNSENVHITTISSSLISISITEAYMTFTNGMSYPLWIYGILLLVITEILFFLDKTKSNTTSVMLFTFGRKIEAFIEAIIIFMSVKLVYRILLTINYNKIYLLITETLLNIITVVIIISVIYMYVWINSRRYKKV